MELVWNTMVQRLKSVPLQELYLIGAHSSAIASMQILNGITHREVESFYHKAGISSSMLLQYEYITGGFQNLHKLFM